MRLSIVIPSFNDQRILEAIASVKKIDAPKNCIEIIVQDGGSNKDIIEKIKGSLDDTDFLFVETDLGIFDAINKGILNSSGDLILTLGSDDRIFSICYKEIRDLFLRGYNFLMFDIHYTNSDWEPIRYWRARKLSFFNYFIGRQYAHFGLVCTPDVYKKVGPFNIRNKINADFEFFYSCLKHKRYLKEKVISRVSVQMRVGGNSSKNFSQIVKANLIMMRFALLNNPLLFFGFFLKPLHKFIEFRNRDSA